MEKTLASIPGLIKVLSDSQVLPVLLQHLQPKAIARLFDEVGLQDAGELMALTPRKNLLAVLDEAIWKSTAGGASEVFEANEFVNWLEVWTDVGEAFVADCLAAMSDEYLTLCVSHLVRVYHEDAVAYSRYDSESEDDDWSDEQEDDYVDSGECDRFGAYLVRSAVEDESDIVRAALQVLWTHTPDRLLKILAALTDCESMVSQRGHHASREHDIAFERQRHREHRGYATTSGAHAFLAFGTTASLQELCTLKEYDAETRRHLSGIGGYAGEHNPIDAAAADEIDDDDTIDESLTDANRTVVDPAGFASGMHVLDATAAQQVQSLLLRLQPLPSSANLLLEHHDNRRALPLLPLLDELAIENYGAFEQRERELAYLANVAISALRSNAAALDASSARSMALATCNLGLELLRAKQLPFGLAREPGLIRLFLIGWRSLNDLHERILQAFVRAAAIPNPAALPKHQRWLSEQVTVGLEDLAKSLAQRKFAEAREAAILLSIAFDPGSCRAIALLLDEIPRFPTSLEGATQPRSARWLESIDDLNRVAAVLSNLCFKF